MAAGVEIGLFADHVERPDAHRRGAVRIAHPPRPEVTDKRHREGNNEHLDQQARRVHVGGDGEVVEPAFPNARHRPGQHRGLEEYIGVGEQNQLAGRLLGSALQGVVLAEPAVGQLGEVQYPQARIRRRQLVEDLAGAVVRSVVDGDDLEVGVIERENRAHRPGEVAFFVARRHQHADARRRGYRLSTRKWHLVHVANELRTGGDVGRENRPAGERQHADDEKGRLH